jgi:hypothetical protein
MRAAVNAVNPAITDSLITGRRAVLGSREPGASCLYEANIRWPMAQWLSGKRRDELDSDGRRMTEPWRLLEKQIACLGGRQPQDIPSKDKLRSPPP